MGETQAGKKTTAGGKQVRSGETEMSPLRCQLHCAEYQEIAADILAYYEEVLDPAMREEFSIIVGDKPKFGYCTINDAEFDQDYSLAMELGRLHVFKGTVAADRAQFKLARRLNRNYPTLVGLSLFDWRRQFVVFLSQKAVAMRRFALVEIAREESR
jgi:hypothetical protein